jgi:hypothetical protein
MTGPESRKLTRKFLMLLLLLLGLGVATASEKPRPKSQCPVCPEPYHCNWITGDCVCDCPDINGNCPASCA